MKFSLLSLCLLVSVVFLTGCLGPRTEKLVTSDILFRRVSAGVTNEVKITNPKDVSFEDAFVSPEDGSVRIKKYRSSANEAAIHAAEEQAKAQQAMFGFALQSVRDYSDLILKLNGIPTPQRTPMVLSPEATALPSNASPAVRLVPAQ